VRLPAHFDQPLRQFLPQPIIPPTRCAGILPPIWEFVPKIPVLPADSYSIGRVGFSMRRSVSPTADIGQPPGHALKDEISMKLSRLGSWPLWSLMGCGLLCATSTGCQTVVGGQTLPSAYYLKDDIQYFRHGPDVASARPWVSRTSDIGGDDAFRG
jgi:hypothetical protein